MHILHSHYISAAHDERIYTQSVSEHNNPLRVESCTGNCTRTIYFSTMSVEETSCFPISLKFSFAKERRGISESIEDVISTKKRDSMLTYCLNTWSEKYSIVRLAKYHADFKCRKFSMKYQDARSESREEICRA